MSDIGHKHFLEMVDYGIYRDAIIKAKSGTPVILDMIPYDCYDTVENFNSFLAQNNCEDLARVVIVHCAIPTLKNRIKARNRQAISMGNPNELREGFYPFEQYGELYKKGSSKKALDCISQQTIVTALWPGDPPSI